MIKALPVLKPVVAVSVPKLPLPPVITALPVLKFVATSVVTELLVTTILPELKFVACAVVACKVVRPFMSPPVINTLALLRLVTYTVPRLGIVTPLILPPVITALPLEKFVVFNVPICPLVAFSPPTHTCPAIPAPPLTINAPVVVLVLGVVFCKSKSPRFNVS